MPDYYVHPTAICESASIGAGTRIWAFCNIQKGAVIGSEVNICDHCFVEQNVIVGNRVTVKNGVSLWDGMTIEDDVFIGPNAVFTNDVYPRSKARHDTFDKTLIGQGATIGANATIVANLTIGQFAFIGAGAVVTKNVPDFSLWLGNPARPAGYVCRCARRLSIPSDVLAHGGKSYRAICSCGLEYLLKHDQLTAADGGDS